MGGKPIPMGELQRYNGMHDEPGVEKLGISAPANDVPALKTQTPAIKPSGMKPPTA